MPDQVMTEPTPKERKRKMRIDYLHQFKTRKDLRKAGYREDGFNRTNDGMTNHQRVLKQRAFKEKGAR